MKEPVFANTRHQVAQNVNISPQKQMHVPEFNQMDSFRNVPKQQEEKPFKVSHIDQFFKNKTSVNNEFYKVSGRDVDNGQTKRGVMRDSDKQAGTMWEETAPNQGEFTEEDFKKLEQRALPKNYMGNDDEDDNLKFY
jgi:hypothetical protein